MKKHEMVLDFTSLLDVILIILFLVLCTMNGKAQKDADKIDDLTKQNKAYETQVAEQGEKIAGLEEKNSELEESLSATSDELAALKNDYAKLETENKYNKEMAQRAQAALEQYLEIGGLGKYDTELYAVFKKSTIVLELNVSRLANNNTSIVLKRSGTRVASYEFYPGKSKKDPTFDPPDQKYYEQELPTNKKNIIEKLNNSLSNYAKTGRYEIVLLTITYGSADTYDELGLETVRAALADLKNNSTKGYILIPADLGEISVE